MLVRFTTTYAIKAYHYLFYKECSIESCCENSSLECDIFPSTSGAVMAPFNNVSVILWWLVLLVKETGVPEKNHRRTIFTTTFNTAFLIKHARVIRSCKSKDRQHNSLHWKARRKPPTCRKSLKTLSHNIVLSASRHEWNSNSQL
jgi:hypothetical protein